MSKTVKFDEFNKIINYIDKLVESFCKNYKTNHSHDYKTIKITNIESFLNVYLEGATPNHWPTEILDYTILNWCATKDISPVILLDIWVNHKQNLFYDYNTLFTEKSEVNKI